jgi:hypothetical protein
MTMEVPRVLTIDCEACVMQRTRACDDCVVTFIVNRQPDDAVVIDVTERRALQMLAESGLIPTLRHQAV